MTDPRHSQAAPHDDVEADLAIRDAASVIAVRRDGDAPRILMGQRAKAAVFMPKKVVFPGGGVDPADADGAFSIQLSQTCLARLAQHSSTAAKPLFVAAMRELQEETGLRVQKDASLQFVFRAITPEGHVRRYDARFFLLEAEALEGDLDDFSAAEDELTELQWVTFEQAYRLNIAQITRSVLEHAQQQIAAPHERLPVPFFDTRTGSKQLRHIA